MATLYLIKIRIILILVIVVVGSHEIYAQSIFDKFENFLLSKKLSISYGVQSSWYKESHIRYVQKRYQRDILIHDVKAEDKDNLLFLLDGQFGVNQYKINLELDISQKYSLIFLVSHIGYHVDVNKEYYWIGLWDNQQVSNTEFLGNRFIQLEHSNGINNLNLGIRRRFNLQSLGSKKFNFEFGLAPNLGLTFTATQGKVINPNGDLEIYNPGNELGGFNYGLELDARLYFIKHWIIGINFNYFHLRIRNAKLEERAYVDQNLIGSNYGINIGYKF